MAKLTDEMFQNTRITEAVYDRKQCKFPRHIPQNTQECGISSNQFISVNMHYRAC